VASWLRRQFCTLKELESLVGKLQHASKVVRLGRTFLRRLLELMMGARRGQRFLRSNTTFRADLVRWHPFMEQWNGVAMVQDPEKQNTRQHVFSDASGSFGCRAWWGAQ